jgi:hypothetical protein
VVATAVVCAWTSGLSRFVMAPLVWVTATFTTRYWIRGRRAVSLRLIIYPLSFGLVV